MCFVGKKVSEKYIHLPITDIISQSLRRRCEFLRLSIVNITKPHVPITEIPELAAAALKR